jgi:hypothetical protein
VLKRPCHVCAIAVAGRSPLVLKGSWTWVKLSACAGQSLGCPRPPWRKPPGGHAADPTVRDRRVAAAVQRGRGHRRGPSRSGSRAGRAAGGTCCRVGPDAAARPARHRVQRADDSNGELRVTGDDDAAVLLWAVAWLDEHHDWAVTGITFRYQAAPGAQIIRFGAWLIAHASLLRSKTRKRSVLIQIRCAGLCSADHIVGEATAR